MDIMGPNINFKSSISIHCMCGESSTFIYLCYKSDFTIGSSQGFVTFIATSYPYYFRFSFSKKLIILGFIPRAYANVQQYITSSEAFTLLDPLFVKEMNNGTRTGT